MCTVERKLCWQYCSRYFIACELAVTDKLCDSVNCKCITKVRVRPKIVDALL